MKMPARQVRNPAFDTVVYLTPKVIKTNTINKIVPSIAAYLIVLKSIRFNLFLKTKLDNINAIINLKAMRLNSWISPTPILVSKQDAPQNIATVTSNKSAFNCVLIGNNPPFEIRL